MRSLDDVAALLQAAGVRYALIGGHAVNTVLEPRFTADIDVTVEIDQGGIATLQSFLEGHGFRVERLHGAALPSGPDFVRFVDDDGTVLEVQAAKTALQRSVIERAVVHQSAHVATPEDLILLKSIANRPKDQLDLLGLVALPGLDWGYIDTHAHAWGTTDVIARLRGQGSGS
jgi:hypothetical protein